MSGSSERQKSVVSSQNKEFSLVSSQEERRDQLTALGAVASRSTGAHFVGLPTERAVWARVLG